MLNTILLLSSLLGATATSTNGQPVSLTITFSGEIVPTQHAEINMYQLDSAVAGIYKIETKHQTTGMEDARIIEQKFLIVDNLDALKVKAPHIAFDDDGAKVNVPETVVVMNWPERMNDKEVVAFYRMVRKARGIEVAKKK